MKAQAIPNTRVLTDRDFLTMGRTSCSDQKFLPSTQGTINLILTLDYHVQSEWWHGVQDNLHSHVAEPQLTYESPRKQPSRFRYHARHPSFLAILFFLQPNPKTYLSLTT